MLMRLPVAYIINPLPILAKAKTLLHVSSSYLASMLGFCSVIYFGVNEVFNRWIFILVALSHFASMFGVLLMLFIQRDCKQLTNVFAFPQWLKKQKAPVVVLRVSGMGFNSLQCPCLKPKYMKTQ